MSLIRITNGFDDMSDAMLSTRTADILGSMTGNTHFPQPNPSLEAVQLALTNFNYARQVASEGNRVDIAQKNERRLELITLLHQLAKYVLYTAGENLVAALSSGFSVAKQPTPAPAITKATNVKIQDGPNPGQVFVSFKKVKHARAYVVEYTTDPLNPNSPWTSQPSTVTKNLVTGLPSGTKLWFRIGSIGNKGQFVYSDVLPRTIQ